MGRNSARGGQRSAEGHQVFRCDRLDLANGRQCPFTSIRSGQVTKHKRTCFY